MSNDSQEKIKLTAHVDREMVKDALKDGLKEWLDEKILAFGKWSLATVACAGVAGLVYFILMLNGWHAPSK